VSKRKVQVSTTSYYFAHGKEPTGEGRWAFYFGTWRTAASAQNQARFYTGTYTDCKRQATVDAANEGHTKISLGS
jgi:hypothetical protein